MASRRSLGGGRVLGSGRNLSPALSPQPQAQHRRNASFLSPSESSVSLSSQTSNSPASTAEPKEDISSKVLLGQNDKAAASASSRLVCPICNEEMVRHNACLICSQCADLAGDASAIEQVRLTYCTALIVVLTTPDISTTTTKTSSRKSRMKSRTGSSRRWKRPRSSSLSQC
jgi:hypothetical protein